MPTSTCRVILGLFLLIASWAKAAELVAPPSAVIGSTIEVSWDAAGENYDSIYVLSPDQPDNASGINKAAILNGRNPVNLVMPEYPGAYELRYWSRSQGKIVARRRIDVVDIATKLEAPAEAEFGNSIEVHWEGPGNQYDQIALFPVAAADGTPALASQGITSGRNPVILHLPDRSGSFELRYLTRQQKRVLARRPINIKFVSARLTAVDQADIGASISVSWEGPGNQYDQIAIVPADSDEGAKPLASAAIIGKKNPVPVRLPEIAGRYEIRYISAKSKQVLGRRPLGIGTVATSLEAPEQATANTLIMVGWQGPGNNYDLIGVFSKGAADDAKPLSSARILNKRNPLPLNLPNKSGEFELRYLTTQSGNILARRMISIRAAGKLAVVFERTRTTETTPGIAAVELILDASGSMLKREAGTRRIDIAKSVLDSLVREHLSADTHFALRVFGHKEANKCRTDLEIPLAPLNPTAVADQIATITAMNLAKTPIATSLSKVPADLAGAKGPKTVVLITDGEETCDGDPAAVIAGLRQQGLDVQISVVGFAIEDDALKTEFTRWANLGGGSYFDAHSADQLMQSLRTVISGPFRVLDGKGDEVATGVIGGAEIVLPVGRYRVETISAKPLVIEEVEIKPELTTKAAF